MKPLFITVHGYKSNEPFDINANLIERIEECTDKNGNKYTNIFMSWFWLNQNDIREAGYGVKESKIEIYHLINVAGSIMP